MIQAILHPVKYIDTRTPAPLRFGQAGTYQLNLFILLSYMTTPL